MHFDSMLKLAQSDRPLGKAVAAGSVPQEMCQLWNRMENRGIEVMLFDCGDLSQEERETPDRWL